MNRRPQLSRHKFVACLAALCVLVQAGLVAWHVSAMFGAAAKAGGEHAMMCHAGSGPAATFGRETKPSDNSHHGVLADCTCCQGLLAGGAMPQGVADMPRPRPDAVRILISDGTLSSGGHPLASDSRAPPQFG